MMEQLNWTEDERQLWCDVFGYLLERNKFVSFTLDTMKTRLEAMDRKIEKLLKIIEEQPEKEEKQEN